MSSVSVGCATSAEQPSPYTTLTARVVELADTGGLNPPDRKIVRVRIPPRAPDEVGQVMDRFASDHHSCQLMVERMACSKSSNDIDDFALRIRFASAPTGVRNGASGSVTASAIASATA